MSAEVDEAVAAPSLGQNDAGADPLAPPIGVSILHVFTVPISLPFIRGQAAFMAERGLRLSAVCSSGAEATAFERAEGVAVHTIPMRRRISPVADIVAVARLARHLRRRRPTIVHAHTPKGGMVAMVAATLARSPIRVYHLHGLRYMTARGRKRVLLRTVERLTCRLSHRVLCVSPSLREFAVGERLCPAAKITVLAGGSVNGVDATGRFNPDLVGGVARDAVRADLGVAPGELVVGFVGRLVRDKGIVELATAWDRLRVDDARIRLVIVGAVERDDPVPGAVLRRLCEDPRVSLVGSVADTAPYYAAMDLLVLPSYREGLPSVPLEAAAMGLPVVATAIRGCVDAVEDGETGTLVPPGDAVRLADAIGDYLADPERRRRHGQAGRERVIREFQRERIWGALHDEYARLLVGFGAARR